MSFSITNFITSINGSSKETFIHIMDMISENEDSVHYGTYPGVNFNDGFFRNIVFNNDDTIQFSSKHNAPIKSLQEIVNICLDVEILIDYVDTSNYYFGRALITENEVIKVEVNPNDIKIMPLNETNINRSEIPHRYVGSYNINRKDEDWFNLEELAEEIIEAMWQEVIYSISQPVG